MSIVICKYRIATDEEVNAFVEYIKSNDMNAKFPICNGKNSMEFLCFPMWHNRGQGNFSNTLDYNKSYKKLAEKHNLFINVPIYKSMDDKRIIGIYKYLKLIYADSWYQGWFMKSGWEKHKSPGILFDNLIALISIV